MKVDIFKRKLMRFLSCFFIFIAFCAGLTAQKSNSYSDMLLEAEHVLYSQPQQVTKITDHVLQNSRLTDELIKASLLKGRAYYISGEYNLAVGVVLESKKLAEAAENTDMQLEISMFGIHLLHLFGLDLAASKYYEFTKEFLGEDFNEQETLYLEGGLALLNAIENILSEDYPRSLDYYKEAQEIFLKIPDPLVVQDTKIMIWETLLMGATVEEAEQVLTEAIGSLNDDHDFQKMVVHQRLGEIYFVQKQYPKAIEALDKSLALSDKLKNKVYKSQIVENLALNYMALEDSNNFYAFKKIGTTLAKEVETDEENAVNSVFNYSSANHQSKRDIAKNVYQRNIIILGGLLSLLLLTGLWLRIRYQSRTQQYLDFIKYFENRQKRHTESDFPKKDLPRSVNIPKETEDALIEKLEQFENSVHFTKKDMSLAQLASQFDTNTKYLSEVINSHKDQNFNSYINQLRINYIVDKLNSNRKYLQYKISYLADESGFSSHSSFATVFKSVTGIPPTVFIDLLRAQKLASTSEKYFEHAE